MEPLSDDSIMREMAHMSQVIARRSRQAGGATGASFVLAVLAAFWLKGKLHRMDGDGWEAYFQSVSTAGLLLRVGAVMAVALAAVAALSVPLFARLGFQEPGLLAALFFVARGAYLLNKFSRRRDELIQKLLKLKR